METAVTVTAPATEEAAVKAPAPVVTGASSLREKAVNEDGEHELQSSWTLLYDKKLANKTGSLKEFEDNLNRLGNFNTVEGFWRHYSHVKDPNEIPKDHNLFMFRDNLTPAWETFPNGGSWIIKVRKQNGLIARLWEELCFACVGELFEEPDVVGVMLSMRLREDILSIWNSDNARPDVKFRIGEKLKEILNLDESTQVEYKHFKSAIRDGSSFRNAKAYVYAAQTQYGSAPPPAQ